MRRAKLASHAWRSLGVGAFTAWAVTADRVLGGLTMPLARWLVVFAAAGAVWFLVGSGSGILWQYLPRLTARDRDGAV